jgi:hypothetical protein
VFAPLYQAGLKFGDVASQATMQGLFPQQADPALQQASAIQSVLGKYQGEDLSSAETLTKIGKDLMQVAPDAGLKALTLAKELAPKGGKITLGAELLDQIDPKDRPRVIDSYQKTGQLPADTQWTTGGTKPIAPGQELARVAGSLEFPIPNDIREFTPEQWKAIDAKMNEEKVRQAAANAAKVNIQDPASQIRVISEINNQTENLNLQLTNIEQAVSTSINNRTPFAQKGFEVLVANVFGGRTRAQEEINRLRNSGTLGQRVENTLGLFLKGEIGKASLDDQMEVLLSIHETAARQRDNIVTPYRSVLGEQADTVAPLTKDRFQLPPLTGGRQYIPMSVVQQYGLSKGQQFRTGGKTFIYNGNGTISPVGAQ